MKKNPTLAWTPETITAMLDASDEAVRRALVCVYNRQTASEKAAGVTAQHNGVGFSAGDADFGTSLAKRVLGKKPLSPKQLGAARNMMKRYRRQLCQEANTTFAVTVGRVFQTAALAA